MKITIAMATLGLYATSASAAACRARYTSTLYVTAAAESAAASSAAASSAAPSTYTATVIPVAASSAAVFAAGAAQSSSSDAPTTITTTSTSFLTSTLSSVTAAASSSAPPKAAAVIQSTTAAAAQTSAAVVVAATGVKRGVAYNSASLANLFASDKSMSWAYNWGATAGALAGSLEFVPMLWSPAHADGWTANVAAAKAIGAKNLLAFNEPDIPSQSNLDLGTCVSGYKQYIQPFAGQFRLGSPAVSNGGGAMGATYLGNFLSQCTGCQVDFVVMHWYSGNGVPLASQVSDFQNQVQKIHAVGGGRPVWVTEFQAAGDDNLQQQFLQQVIPWLDQQSYVERYSYFGAFDGTLVAGEALSAMGSLYASLS